MVRSILFTGITAALLLCGAFAGAEEKSLRFNTKDSGNVSGGVPIPPWKVVEIEPDYGGLWVVAGDIDGDGAVEIVSAENHNEGDTHYTSAVAAQKLDGTVLWTWGDPDAGRKKWHHDVACQIHDWDGDGAAEVVLLADRELIALHGASGELKKRFSIPEAASDCLVFCDLSGKGRPMDVLVKTRYEHIWAYDIDGNQLWHTKHPGGYRTAHQPRPYDIDGDGRDEVMAGYAMLNFDGTVRWVYKSEAVDQGRGHLDCVRLYRKGESPADWRFVLTCCGANNIAMIDGERGVVWELSGHHFESIDVGRILPGLEEPQVLVDIDHRPMGEGPLWVIDSDGNHVGAIMTDYARHHELVDWTGDGLAEIATTYMMALYGNDGKRVGTFQFPDLAPEDRQSEMAVHRGDFTGDGVPDLLIAMPGQVCLYRNENGKRPEPPAPFGTGLNVSLY